MPANDVEVRLWSAAAACFAAFALLGAYVAQRTPTRIDVEAAALRGEWTPLAVAFTALGRWPAVLAVLALAAGLAFALRAQPAAIGLVAVAQAASQAAVSGLKHVFHRTRPDYWLVTQEPDTSYPSGHAVTAVVLYVALALLAWRTPALPRSLAVPLVTVLGICVAGIPWSRLALGAHYLTDVTGGLLFGAGWLCASIALLLRFAPERILR